MRITDLLAKESIELRGTPKTKEETIGAMADLMEKSGKISDKKGYIAGLLRREEESTTAVGEGIAIPHYKGAAVKRPGLAAMVVKDGTDFDSIDGEPVKLIFAIAAPDTKENVHLDVLSKLSVLLMDEEFSKNLINAKSVDEFIAVIDKAETAKDAEDGAEEKAAASGAVKLLAVTGCPTGIAHTYMAAEGLQKAAEKAGCSIKVETRGSGGAKNVLTDSEIAEADCIIVAADTKVPMERFNGKKVIVTQVSDGISKADELVAKAVKGDVPIFTAKDTGSEGAAKAEGKEGIGHQIYKHLMSGVSHMLPFVIGGGILIAIAFLLDDFTIDPGNFGMNTPIAAFFKTIGGVAFGLMLPVLAGYIAYSIADRPGLAVGFVGGMLASTGNSIVEFQSAYSGGLQGYLANTVFNASGTTVSGFLGALVAGFVAGYIVLLLRKLFSKLPESLEGIKPTLLYPVLGIFIMGALMLFIFNPVIGVVNDALANLLNSMGSSSKIILGLVLGGMMAIDMGGPINKAAYVFGTMAIAQGNYDIMAAVMIGGMVPPIGIALATTFFKSRFTKAERQSGISNYVMGLAFITEGAIPFAASDPLHVIPATAIGSAAAGALSMMFNCTLMAPHGGIFVFPVVGNWPMYLVSLLAGSVVTMLLLALLKKPINK
ncbi:MAG: fructose-specific PTS transporter subunit EIIC [Clostridia bacterium]|nr:fructose-specific PTS transporter subunit EIIC [Clostridia bacterium]